MSKTIQILDEIKSLLGYSGNKLLAKLEQTLDDRVLNDVLAPIFNDILDRLTTELYDKNKTIEDLKWKIEELETDNELLENELDGLKEFQNESI